MVSHEQEKALKPRLIEGDCMPRFTASRGSAQCGSARRGGCGGGLLGMTRALYTWMGTIRSRCEKVGHRTTSVVAHIRRGEHMHQSLEGRETSRNAFG